MGFDGEGGGMAAGQGGKIWNFIHQGRSPHAAAIIYRLRTFGGVQDKGDIAIFELIHDVWAAFIDLVHHGAVNAETRRGILRFLRWRSG